jgi:hypothetical protein
MNTKVIEKPNSNAALLAASHVALEKTPPSSELHPMPRHNRPDRNTPMVCQLAQRDTLDAQDMQSARQYNAANHKRLA